MKRSIPIKPFVAKCFPVKVRFRTLGKHSGSRLPNSRMGAEGGNKAAGASLNTLGFHAIFAFER